MVYNEARLSLLYLNDTVSIQSSLYRHRYVTIVVESYYDINIIVITAN